MTQIIQVQTTTDREESAIAIARGLVEKQLAACVHVHGPMTSVYRWQNAVEMDKEWVVLAKTTQESYPVVEERIKSLHSYEEPEIIVVEVRGGSASYLNWIREEVKPS